MPAPPLRTAISGTPTNAAANAGLGALWDYVTTLLGSTGNAVDARTALGFDANVREPIQSVTATVAANALTLGLQPTVLDFRSSTLTSGAPNRRTVASALSLVVPSGATLGTTSAVQSRVVMLAIDNAGTVELAVTNIAGGLNLDETSLINTTAISAAATAANVVYSTTARTGVPFRVVGFVDSTQATAGTWASAPTLVQGYGGQAMSALQSAGFGQSWQNLTGSRSLGTTFFNTTGRAISVIVAVQSSVTAGITVSTTVNGSALPGITFFANGAGYSTPTCFLVPPGASYAVSATATAGTATLQQWSELR